MLSSCYRGKSQNTQIDISEVPTHVAVVVPIVGEIPDVLPSPSPSFPVDFGVVPVSETKTQIITLINVGPYPASNLKESSSQGLALPFLYKSGTYPGEGGDCNNIIEASKSCTIVIDYSPTEARISSQTLGLSYVNGVIEVPITFSMKGTTPAELSLSDGATYSFGSVAANTSIDKVFTLTNSGASRASQIELSSVELLTAPFTIKGGTYPGVGGTCTGLLDAGSSCTLIVSFSPSSVGDFKSPLVISYHDSLQIQSIKLSLTGSGN